MFSKSTSENALIVIINLYTYIYSVREEKRKKIIYNVYEWPVKNRK